VLVGSPRRHHRAVRVLSLSFAVGAYLPLSPPADLVGGAIKGIVDAAPAPASAAMWRRRRRPEACSHRLVAGGRSPNSGAFLHGATKWQRRRFTSLLNAMLTHGWAEGGYRSGRRLLRRGWAFPYRVARRRSARSGRPESPGGSWGRISGRIETAGGSPSSRHTAPIDRAGDDHSVPRAISV